MAKGDASEKLALHINDPARSAYIEIATINTKNRGPVHGLDGLAQGGSDFLKLTSLFRYIKRMQDT